MCFAVHHHLRNDEVIWRKFPSSSVYRKVVLPRSNHSSSSISTGALPGVLRPGIRGSISWDELGPVSIGVLSRPSVSSSVRRLLCPTTSLRGPEASGVEQHQRGALTGQRRNDNTGDDNISSRNEATRLLLPTLTLGRFWLLKKVGMSSSISENNKLYSKDWRLMSVIAARA